MVPRLSLTGYCFSNLPLSNSSFATKAEVLFILNAGNGLVMLTRMPTLKYVKGSDPAVDVPRPQSPTATKRDYDHKARFGLKDRSAAAFLKAFGFPVSELQRYVRCPPDTPSSCSYAHNTYAQLPKESNLFDDQDDYDCFEALHWYAHYVVTALKDLAALWPSVNSSPPALIPSAAADGFMLDGSTCDPQYESDDTDSDDLWSS
ncbi:hypothetical protein MPER_09229, partial [Moniliophthora perniciosa FA553]